MRSIFVLFLVCLLTPACSKVPSQSSYPYSYQHKVQSADHWERLAKKVASKQAAPLIRKNDLAHSVYIQKRDQSDFGMAFNTFLETELHKKGVLLSETKGQDSIIIDWTVQKVRHNSDRRNPSPVAGIFGGVGYLAMEFLGGDFYYPNTSVPNTEMIISTRIVDLNNNVLSIETETFYVDDRDTTNYWFIKDYDKHLSYVTKGSVVCKDNSSLNLALGESAQLSTIKTLTALKYCAVMSKNYPVEIVSNDGQSLLIRSIDGPVTYVTSSNSARQI